MMDKNSQKVVEALAELKAACAPFGVDEKAAFIAEFGPFAEKVLNWAQVSFPADAKELPLAYAAAGLDREKKPAPQGKIPLRNTFAHDD